MSDAEKAAAGRNTLADHMASGCPSLAEAYRRMGIGTTTGKRYWRAICDGLGAQAA